DGYDHFMLKEIMEQPRALQQTIGTYFKIAEGIDFENFQISKDRAAELKKIFIVACGTSYHAGLVGKYWLERFSGLPVEVDYASEFRYRDPLIESDHLVIVISQSGETADTLAGLRLAKDFTEDTLGLVNVVGSTITREARHVIYTHAGPEIGVASTKAFTTQLAALLLLSIHLGRLRGKITLPQMKKFHKEMKKLPQVMETCLSQQDKVACVAGNLANYSHFLFLGRNLDFPIALEGALKLKEISYLHAEAYPAGEMKHGPIALIDEKMPTIALVTRNRVQEKIFSNLQEIKARKGMVVGVVSSGDSRAKELLDHCLEVPEFEEYMMPILNIVPLQLLAYHVAKGRGCDIDKPRNLAKSVTVE
ncbi:MAG: glutamine--fructose-6-phosphate transaminase (isomerizing), partial [Candidatus Wallbacteria bacterium]|nr:glutamine--fructose-6-phosphate transaminase (isomerizing) [Candidatus Wallbacteria bacterium]